MIKNIIIITILCFFAASCGKKGDPKYKNLENKTMIQTILIKKA